MIDYLPCSQELLKSVFQVVREQSNDPVSDFEQLSRADLVMYFQMNLVLVGSALVEYLANLPDMEYNVLGDK